MLRIFVLRGVIQWRIVNLCNVVETNLQRFLAWHQPSQGRNFSALQNNNTVNNVFLHQLALSARF